MLTVHKFQFGISDIVEIEMPKDAKILHVECQNFIPCIWAHVNTENEKELRHFRVIGTGHLVDGHLKHVGSFQQGIYVWHLWEE
jgi:hypothetical protein